MFYGTVGSQAKGMEEDGLSTPVINFTQISFAEGKQLRDMPKKIRQT